MLPVMSTNVGQVQAAQRPAFPLQIGMSRAAVMRLGHQVDLGNGVIRLAPYRAKSLRFTWALLTFAHGRLKELTLFAKGMARCEKLEVQTRQVLGRPTVQSATGVHIGAAWKVKGATRWATYRTYTPVHATPACWYGESAFPERPLP